MEKDFGFWILVLSRMPLYNLQNWKKISRTMYMK